MSKWDGITHNSWQSLYRSPFGALVEGQTLRLFIRVPDHAVEARLRLWMEDGEHILEGERVADGFAFRFCAPKKSGLFWYHFLLFADGETRAYGGESGVGTLCAPHGAPSYQVSVYRADFTTPAWFRRSICYQIFPDRFARSAGADPEARAEAHRRLGRRVLLHENWDEEVLYSPLPGEEFYDPCDFYGGDLEGVTEKLPYLKSLGVGSLYLNPVFESPSNHRYNTADYEKVDSLLGGDAALCALLGAARAADVGVLLDGVFSHTGDDSVYFNKYGRYTHVPGAYESLDSPYAPWYDFTDFPDGYHSWWGFATLPELRENEPSYRAFVAGLFERYSAMGTRGWRLDVADELPDDFIAFLRARLKALDPEGLLLGEVWEDASNKEAYGAMRRYVQGEELDSAMCYPFRDAVVDFLLARCGAGEFVRRLMRLREHYPKPFYDAQMNLLGSHDTPRIRTVLSEAPGRDELPREAQALYTPDAEAAARGKARHIMAAAIQMAMPGVPCIYYGDEAGMTGMADPFCRRPYPWGREEADTLAAYRKLTAARKSCPALSEEGGCGMRAYGESVFAMLRSVGEESALLLVNRSGAAHSLCVRPEDFTDGPDAARLRMHAHYRDVLCDTAHTHAAGGLRIHLAPRTAALLLSGRETQRGGE